MLIELGGSVRLLIMLLAVGVALPAHGGSTSTFICSNAAGHKAIQDSPCQGAATVREIPTVNRAEDPIETWKKQSIAHAASSNFRTTCWYHRQLVENYGSAANKGYKPKQQAESRDVMVKHQAYIDKNCAGVGY
jgi:hypothetical protein